MEHAPYKYRIKLSGQVFGYVAPTSSIETFNQLVHLVMPQTPYRTASRVFWLVDGGPGHRRSTFPGRLKGMYPNAQAVMLPCMPVG